MSLLRWLTHLWGGDPGDPEVLGILPRPRVQPKQLPLPDERSAADREAERQAKLERAKQHLGERWCLTKGKPLPAVHAPAAREPAAVVRPIRRGTK